MKENPLRVTALTPNQMARLLAAAGERRITEKMVVADIKNGAPVNPDGTLSLIEYAAWLAKEPQGHGD